MKSFTIYGVRNTRFFAGPNPRGVMTWYPTRNQRDAAHKALVEKARKAGLSNPADFLSTARSIRTESQRDWYLRLEQHKYLRANGIDSPQNGPDHAWGEETE